MSNTISTSPAFIAGERKSGVSATGVWGLPAWFQSGMKWLVISVFGLIVLGGSVRIMNAGLACPDWPLCFGDIIPDYHPQVYFEFIHRVVAGVLGLATVSMMRLLWKSAAPRALKRWGVVAVAILLAQVIAGGLTVTMKLKAGVVTTHLMLGSAFFLTLLWIYLAVRDRSVSGGVSLPAWVSKLCVIVGLAIYAQFFMGGLVASNYAALACTHFPACLGDGVWFPTFSGGIGIHIMHRIGAYGVFAVSLVSWILLRRSGSANLSKLSGLFFALVCVQICVGVANVLFHIPALIAGLHLAIGAGLLSIALRQLHVVFRLAQ